MRIDGISLENFRNYELSCAEFDPGINVIAGQNAQGKTNLLEAVYMLSCAKSFRTRFDKELIRKGADFAHIKGDIFSNDRNQTVEISLGRGPGQAKRVMRNGVKTAGSELPTSLTCVLFCPDDLNLVREGAAVRRRFMDMAISQLRPAYGKLISEYGKIIDHKTRILRDWREKPSLLEALDDFSERSFVYSARIIRFRAAFIERLKEEAPMIHSDFSGGRETLELSYKTVSTVTDPLGREQDILDAVFRHGKAHKQAELSAGQCLTGAHKDDLEVNLNGESARAFASQGQARTAALSLKLAEREIMMQSIGEYPLLLLDDVLSELDRSRQEFVLKRIGGGQTLITCCEDESVSSRTGGRVITVESGKISPAKE